MLNPGPVGVALWAIKRIFVLISNAKGSHRKVSVESEMTGFEERKGETPGFRLFVSVARGSI